MSIKKLPTEKDIEDYELLEEMLNALRLEMDILSKKKPNEQLNKMKIKLLNRVLEPLKIIFKHEPSYKFLDIPSEEDLPSYSDVVLIISQYEKAIDDFRDTYRKYDTEYDDYRWNTKEYPFD